MRDGKKLFRSYTNHCLVENIPIEGKRKPEVLWPIFKIHHQMSRYIFDLFYKKKEMSRELYDYCLREKWADETLIAKWKKPGFERLCCV
jgi:bud site selection protein 31